MAYHAYEIAQAAIASASAGVFMLVLAIAFVTPDDAYKMPWLIYPVQLLTMFNTVASIFLFSQFARNTKYEHYDLTLWGVLLQAYAQVMLYCCAEAFGYNKDNKSSSPGRTAVQALAISLHLILAINIDDGEFNCSLPVQHSGHLALNPQSLLAGTGPNLRADANYDDFSLAAYGECTDDMKMISWYIFSFLCAAFLIMAVGEASLKSAFCGRTFGFESSEVADMKSYPFMRAVVLTIFAICTFLAAFQVSFIQPSYSAVSFFFALLAFTFDALVLNALLM